MAESLNLRARDLSRIAETVDLISQVARRTQDFPARHTFEQNHVAVELEWSQHADHVQNGGYRIRSITLIPETPKEA